MYKKDAKMSYLSKEESLIHVLLNRVSTKITSTKKGRVIDCQSNMFILDLMVDFEVSLQRNSFTDILMLPNIVFITYLSPYVRVPLILPVIKKAFCFLKKTGKGKYFIFLKSF